jgi:hypothetical protein
MKDRLFRYLRQPVEVRCLGIIYRGEFMGADEEWIYLKGETTWLTLPLAEVSSFKPRHGPEQERIFRGVEGEGEPGAEEREGKRRPRRGPRKSSR